VPLQRNQNRLGSSHPVPNEHRNHQGIGKGCHRTDRKVKAIYRERNGNPDRNHRHNRDTPQNSDDICRRFKGWYRNWKECNKQKDGQNRSPFAEEI